MDVDGEIESMASVIALINGEFYYFFFIGGGNDNGGSHISPPQQHVTAAENSDISLPPPAQQHNHPEIGWVEEPHRTVTDISLDIENLLRDVYDYMNTNFDGGETMSGDGTMTHGGLSEEVISRYLKTRNCSDDDEVEDELDAKVCAVCLDDLCRRRRQTMIAVLECGHEYHPCCIKQWLQRKNFCPLCKRIGVRIPQPRMIDLNSTPQEDVDGFD